MQHNELYNKQALESVNNPEWSNSRRMHDWRNYISEEIKEAWYSFTETQRMMLYRQADKRADEEEYE